MRTSQQPVNGLPARTLEFNMQTQDGGTIHGLVLYVEQGGNVTHRVPTPQPTFACGLGGDDGRTLHALCAPGSHPDEVAGKAGGAIYTMRVEHPHAGRP